jgi:hypothetical protein
MQNLPRKSQTDPSNKASGQGQVIAPRPQQSGPDPHGGERLVQATGERIWFIQKQHLRLEHNFTPSSLGSVMGQSYHKLVFDRELFTSQEWEASAWREEQGDRTRLPGYNLYHPARYTNFPSLVGSQYLHISLPGNRFMDLSQHFLQSIYLNRVLEAWGEEYEVLRLSLTIHGGNMWAVNCNSPSSRDFFWSLFCVHSDAVAKVGYGCSGKVFAGDHSVMEAMYQVLHMCWW